MKYRVYFAATVFADFEKIHPTDNCSFLFNEAEKVIPSSLDWSPYYGFPYFHNLPLSVVLPPFGCTVTPEPRL